MTYEDLSYKGGDLRDHSLILKEELIEPGQRFYELTLCMRVYSFAYSFHGFIKLFELWSHEGKLNKMNGYSENVHKWFAAELRAPGVNTFDVSVWIRSSDEGYELAKNEWSYFRKAEKDLNALEWQHVCFVYSVPKKNTGIVINGQILANRNQSDSWANENNFFPSEIFGIRDWSARYLLFDHINRI